MTWPFLAAAIVLGQTSAPAKPSFELLDGFDRNLIGHALTLVDWEGPIANPAIKFKFKTNRPDVLPIQVTLSANGPRLMFNLYSEVGPNGPTKTLLLEPGHQEAEFFMSIFPDRDGLDEDYELTVTIQDAFQRKTVVKYPVHVIDEDKARPNAFQVALDFDQDPTDFTKDPLVRTILRRAADEVTYYFDDMGFDEVQAGAEKSFIFDVSGFTSGKEVTNTNPYRGFLMYAAGIKGPEKRSGGGIHDTAGLQTIGGKPTQLKRSGTDVIEVIGNYNALGWTINDDDELWWAAGNMSFDKHDFYSVQRHEMTHCLAFHYAHPGFIRLVRDGKYHGPAATKYLGRVPTVNNVQHFVGCVDPTSQRGCFGNEYDGNMPRKRWLLTKFDILAMQDAGYKLRPTTPFMPLSVAPVGDVVWRTGETVNGQVVAKDGIRAYCFDVVGGKLPKGVSLDSFTGAIVGKPEEAGRFEVTVRVRDNDPRGREARVKARIEVK
jgi:hypothetical protein